MHRLPFTTLVTMLALAAAMATAATAQTRPDLSGTWVLDWNSVPLPEGGRPPGTGPGHGAPRGGAWGEQFRATESPATLSVEYTDRDVPFTLIFKLDGSASVNAVAAGRGQVNQTSRAVWQGSKLVITTAAASGDQKRTLSLNGGTLVLEITIPIENGPPIVSTLRYTKG